MTPWAKSVIEYLQERREAAWEVFAGITFGIFMGSLILLLVLLYAGAPLV